MADYVTFDCDAFRAAYPAFSDEGKCTDEALTQCFDLAVEIIGNDENSLIPYAPKDKPPVKTRAAVLMLLTCHIATIMLLWDDTQAAPITSATQGSVSAGFGSNSDTANDPAWWMQTKCGATAWVIVRGYVSGGVYFGAIPVLDPA